MANKPLRPCRKSGCGNLAKDGYCTEHQHLRDRDKARKRSQDWHWMYGTNLWTHRLRPDQLLAEPFCRDCARRSLRTVATVVDHIIPHKGNWRMFSDPRNLQSLCVKCHNAKTMRELNAEKKQKK